jgi:hypothetical protein
MNTVFTTTPYSLIAYWRLNETNDGTEVYYTDSGSNSTLTYDPSLTSPYIALYAY